MSDMAANSSSLTWYQDVPRGVGRQALFGSLLIATALGGFAIWAGTAPLAAAVISSGSFVASGENKIVQHLEGGIIEDLDVREGQQVQKGQVLITLDETAALASQQQLELRLVRLEAIRARLVAQASGALWYTEPTLAVDPAIKENAVAMFQSQKAHFEGWRDKLTNDLQLYEQNIIALQSRRGGELSQLDFMEQQRKMLLAESESKVTLLDKGLVTRSEVFEIQRAIADADGDMARLRAETEEIDAQVIKYQGELVQARDEARQGALQEMQSVEIELDTVREQIRQAQNILGRTQIKSPVAGTVVRLYYHTTGGVVESGKPILEILPTGVPLIIEVPVLRNQIDEVKEGQVATVRLVALNQRTTPVLTGQVYYVSADSVPDTSSGQSREVYLARVSVSPEQIGKIPGFSPTPGMPAEIMIETQERTFFEYLVKPILDSMNRAFKEN